MNKNKLKLYLLYFFSFGIAYFILKKKAEQVANVENTELSLSNEISIDVDKLILLLGGIDNIVNCTNTISSVKIFLKDLSKVNIDSIKKMNVKGFMKGKDYISFLFGDFSHLLKDEINKKIG